MNNTFYLKPHIILITGGFLAFFLSIYFFTYPAELHPIGYMWPLLAAIQFYFCGLFIKRKGLEIHSNQISILDYHSWKRKYIPLEEIASIDVDNREFTILLKSGKEFSIDKRE